MDKGGALNTNIKKYVAGMQGARKNIQSGTDIPENMTTIKNNFMDLESSIKAQTGVIQNLQQFHKSMAATANRNYEAKKFLNKVFDRIRGQIKVLFKLVKDSFIENKKKTDFWEKIYQEIDKHMTTLRDQADTQEKMFSAVLKFLNAKEEISSQFIKLMLYKKHLLWKDLNVPYDDYIHGQVKAVINLIKSSQQKFGYAPTTIQFKPPKFESEGEESTYNSLLQIIMGDFNDLIQTVKNYSNLNGQPQVIEGINKNKRTIKGLREKIEHLTVSYQQLLQKYRKLQISKGRSSNTDETNLQEKIQQMQTLLHRKQQQIIQLKQMNMKSEAVIKQYKDKNKELEDQVSKWQTNQLPKIRDLEQTQKILFDQFTKVKKDLQAYNSIFQAQREEKARLFLEVKNQKEKVKGLADLLGKEKRKKKQLLAQIARQQQINLLLTDQLKLDKQ